MRHHKNIASAQEHLRSAQTIIETASGDPVGALDSARKALRNAKRGNEERLALASHLRIALSAIGCARERWTLGRKARAWQAPITYIADALYHCQRAAEME